MSQTPTDRPDETLQPWQTPRLGRIGSVRDFAVREIPLTQANTDKRS